MRLFEAATAAISLFTGLALGAPTLSSLARDVARVESVREIKDLQRTFSQLAQFGRYADMAKLFSQNGTLHWGNETAKGPTAIESWLVKDVKGMDGVKPGSLDTLVAENPLVSLSADGLTAKGRWNGLRFQGDGVGGTRIQGGIYENEFVLVNGVWKFRVLKYYAMYAGPYVGGWRNVGGAGIPIIPYHFTPEDAGIPIPTPPGDPTGGNVTAEQLAARITRLNDEDAVRNIQNSYGYYVDRRMWTDVVQLFTTKNSTAKVTGVGSWKSDELRLWLHRMGYEGLKKGNLNDHPIFDTIVQVSPDGKEAIARGFEIGMLGDAVKHTASWEFNVFRNRFVKEDGLWKLKDVEITPLLAADYYTGWGNGGTLKSTGFLPPFLDVGSRSSQISIPSGTNTTLADLQRQLARSAAYDGVENASAAYGYYLDDLQCKEMGALHAAKGHKASPFTGFYQTPERITQACETQYGTNRTGLRSSISFHWRPQSVVLVSEDGRSATLRARLLQPSTSKDKAGSFNGAIYHDQMVLEDGKWKLWSITIDEFYWQSSSWENGWAKPNPSNNTSPGGESSLAKKYPPDISIAAIGEREATFSGGAGPTYLIWPEIQRMWFSYRNLVTGKYPQTSAGAPQDYWPGCVPCQAMPSWKLEANGYQEPPTGPAT
jgi:hypothetical protein